MGKCEEIGKERNEKFLQDSLKVPIKFRLVLTNGNELDGVNAVGEAFRLPPLDAINICRKGCRGRRPIRVGIN